MTLEPLPEAKPGIKTTEFWVAILVIVGSTTASLMSVLPPKWAAIASAVSATAYAISRGLAKK